MLIAGKVKYVRGRGYMGTLCTSYPILLWTNKCFKKKIKSIFKKFLWWKTTMLYNYYLTIKMLYNCYLTIKIFSNVFYIYTVCILHIFIYIYLYIFIKNIYIKILLYILCVCMRCVCVYVYLYIYHLFTYICVCVYIPMTLWTELCPPSQIYMLSPNPMGWYLETRPLEGWFLMMGLVAL